jgi:MFS family permease
MTRPAIPADGVLDPPADAPGAAPAATARETRRVIFAASLGTVFEWYDFYLYGSLAVFFGGLFFPPGNATAGLLASLATFGAGFAVRPFGALVFGRLGDVIGRKYTFLVTILLMGLSTALVGVLPTYASIGIWAPVALVSLRLVQGLALGGEYGGAATYVAEHAPPGRRGRDTAWIQTTATLGFFLSLAVILATRVGLGEAAFRAWGWRVPFLISLALLAVSPLHPPAAARVAGVRGAQGAGEDVQAPARRELRRVAEPAHRAHRAVRAHGRAGGGVVRGAVLRALLPPEHAQGAVPRLVRARRGGAAHRHPVLPRVRAALRPRRAASGS